MNTQIKALKREKGKGIRGALYGYTIVTLLLIGLLDIFVYFFSQSSFLSSIALFIVPFCIFLIANFLIIAVLRKVRRENNENIFGLYVRLLKKQLLLACLLACIWIVTTLHWESFLSSYLLRYIFDIDREYLIIGYHFISCIVPVFLFVTNIATMLYIIDGHSVGASLKNAFTFINENIKTFTLEVLKWSIYLFFFLGIMVFYILSFPFWYSIQGFLASFLFTNFYISVPLLLIFIAPYLVSDTLLGIICLYEEKNVKVFQDSIICMDTNVSDQVTSKEE